MSAYLHVIYPAVLVVSAVLVLHGVVTLIAVGTHRSLEWVVTATWIAVVVQAAAVFYVWVVDGTPDAVLTIGYLLATVGLLPLLGIGRLGTPEAAAADPDPNRPVLAPDQIARVDAGAAIAVGIALAVASWRLTIVLGG
ncbi:hypothetical protein [Demequina sp.]|uniref:hypothetical protein n=1 Tax=Demequina sp. TaxID=2050685 RepID=UPI003D12EB9A